MVHCEFKMLPERKFLAVDEAIIAVTRISPILPVWDILFALEYKARVAQDLLDQTDRHVFEVLLQAFYQRRWFKHVPNRLEGVSLFFFLDL